MITEEKKACFVDEWIEVKTTKQNLSYYENLGYSEIKPCVFKVHPWDITKGSDKKVKLICPICRQIREVKFNNFYRANSIGVCNNCKGEAIKKDLTGQRFGRLIAVKDIGQKIISGQKYRNWLCECDCGNTCEVISTLLIQGHTKSCGCLVKYTSSILGKNNKKDLIGQKFSRLTVIEETDRRQGNNIIWKCLCDCGHFTEVAGSELIKGHTKSCGCLVLDKINQRHRDQGHFVKADHTQEEIDRHLKETNRNGDTRWNKLSKELRKNAECLICGSKENLVVHHLNGYWEFPEQRYDKDNLVVLCISCHQKYHFNCGFKNSKKETFNEWRKSL